MLVHRAGAFLHLIALTMLRWENFGKSMDNYCQCFSQQTFCSVKGWLYTSWILLQEEYTFYTILYTYCQKQVSTYHIVVLLQFLNQVHAWFLEITFMYAPEAINN